MIYTNRTTALRITGCGKVKANYMAFETEQQYLNKLYSQSQHSKHAQSIPSLPILSQRLPHNHTISRPFQTSHPSFHSFVLATASTPGVDLCLQEQQLADGSSLVNKLWNAAKFVLMNLAALPPAEWDALGRSSFREAAAFEPLAVPEKWIISKVHGVVDQYDSYFKKYEFGHAGRALHDLFRGEFAGWYIETAKERLYKGAPAARVSRVATVFWDLGARTAAGAGARGLEFSGIGLE